MMVVVPFLISLMRQPESPISPAQIAVFEMKKVVADLVKRPSSLKRSSPIFEPSWTMTWPAVAVGVPGLPKEVLGFSYRLSPNPGGRSFGNHPPFLFEAYRNGFPTYGELADGMIELARPLGFVYSKNGECVNVSVQVFSNDRWSKRKMLPVERIVLGKVIACNEYLDAPPAKSPDKFGTPWIRITASGYGEYWIDRDLNCLGPYGSSCRIISGCKETLTDLVSGHYSD